MFSHLLVTLVSLYLSFSGTCGFNYYCTITCNGAKHTMCAYSRGGGAHCLNNEQVYLSLEEKRWILELHNNFRQRVARGKEYSSLNDHGLPPASNMIKMVWDPELALLAKRWADQCDAGEHDECRTTMGGDQVGQNAVLGQYAYVVAETELGRAQRIGDIITIWKNEVANLDTSLIQNYNATLAGDTKHFTQMIWATTTLLGCGYTEFRLPNNLVKFRFVCNYNPMGNIPSQPVYKPGSGCSGCSKTQSCSGTWDALCWGGTRSDFTTLSSSSGLEILSPHFLLYLSFLVFRYI